MTKILKYLTLIGLVYTQCLCAQIFQASGSFDSTNNIFSLSWLSETGYEYDVERSLDLSSGSWITIGSGIRGQLPYASWSSDIQLEDKAFFRVRRKQPTLTTPTEEEEELLANTKFTSSTSPWFTIFNQASGATGSITGGSSLTVDITNGGSSSFHVQLIHNGISLIDGEDYELSFTARTSSGSKSIAAKVQATTQPSANTFLDENVNLTTISQDFTFPFTMSSANGSSSRVAFNLGGNTSNVIFDCISLIRKTSSETPTIVERLGSHLLNKRLSGGNNFAAYMATPKLGAQEDYVLLREAGFAHCRIGYRLDELVGPAPDFLIPQVELDEIKKLVNWCNSEGLIAIVNPIHNWANGPGFTYPDDLPKLLKIWTQVATEFSQFSTEKVVFEILNEPHANTNIADVTTQALAAIRNISGNEERAIIISGEGFSTRQAMINAFNNDAIPTDDPWLIGTFHYYDPRPFTTPDNAGNGMAIPWADSGPSDAEFKQVVTDFAAVQAANEAWATRNTTEPIPIFLGEFGCDNIAAEADRQRWLAWITLQAESQGFSWSHWLMYNDVDFSKGMGPWTSAVIADPSLRIFQTNTVQSLIRAYAAEDGTLSLGSTVGSGELGFQGTGYVELDAVNESFEIPFHTPRQQEYMITLRYQTTIASQLEIESREINGTIIGTTIINLDPVTFANSWDEVEAKITLAADNNGILTIKSLSNNSIRIDGLKINQ